MTEYRYAVDPQTGTITRASVYCIRDRGWDTSEEWRWYWDGDGIVAFTINYGVRSDIYPLSENSDTDRAIAAYKAARNYGDRDSAADAMKRVARRIANEWHAPNWWNADFICVSLDRGYDLYALSMGGDPDNEWRDEIEALYHGEVYRMAVETHTGIEPWIWSTDDDVCEEWYGQDRADAALEHAFPLTEFPAELLVEDRAS